MTAQITKCRLRGGLLSAVGGRFRTLKCVRRAYEGNEVRPPVFGDALSIVVVGIGSYRKVSDANGRYRKVKTVVGQHSKCRSLLPLLLQQRLGVFAGGVGLAAEHAGEFGDAVFPSQQGDVGDGTPFPYLFAHDVMRGSVRGDGGQVRDAEDLPLFGDLLHLFADGIGGLAADVGIDFVKNEHWDFVHLGKNRLESQHDAGHFAGTRDGAQRAGGFADVRSKLEFNRVEAGAGELRASFRDRILHHCGDGDIEMALGKAEVLELFDSSLAQLRNDFAALRGEVLADLPDFRIELFEFAVDAVQLLVALFELLQLPACLVTESDDFLKRRAILALEGMDDVKAFLEFEQTGGIDVELVGVVREVALQIVQAADELLVLGNEIRGAGIDALQFLQGAAQLSGLGEQGSFVFAQEVQGRLAQFQKLRCIAGALIFLLNPLLLFRMKFGRRDFVYLKTEEIQLLGVSLFVDDERGFLSFECGTTMDEFGKGIALPFQAAESVEDRKLTGGVEERLMVMRAMHIDEPLTDGAESGERGGRTVDKLAIGAGTGKGALENELAIFDRFETVFVEKGFERSLEPGDVKYGFDGTGIAATADECAVGAFAQNEVQGADDDGFARAGFAGDGIVAWLDFQSQVGHQSKVFNAQRCQHVTFVPVQSGD